MIGLNVRRWYTNTCNGGEKMRKFKLILIALLIGVIVSALEITSRIGLFIFFAIGVAITLSSFIMFKRVKFIRNSGICFGGLLMLLPLLSTSGIWLGMIGALLILLFDKNDFSVSSISGLFSKRDKQEYIFVNSREDTPEPGSIHRYDWIGTQVVGDEPYEWNDINAGQFAGDTIIDLGNTILPAKENVIVIRKGFGRVRILVPYGVGVMIHHHGFGGQVEFENQTYTLSNESIQLYSAGYNRSTKRVKIYTTIVAGKVEVIEA